MTNKIDNLINAYKQADCDLRKAHNEVEGARSHLHELTIRLDDAKAKHAETQRELLKYIEEEDKD